MRRLARAALAVTWTAFCYLAWMPGALLSFPSRRSRRHWQSIGIRLWTRGLLRILRIRVQEVGTPPALPAFLVANHLSWVDILVLGARFGPAFVAKKEISGWPVLGHLARATGTIFVDRGRRRDVVRVLRAMDRAHAAGATIVLFPEGTSSRGDTVQPLRPALLDWAAARAVPIHPVALAYGTTAPGWNASDTVCWFDDIPFGAHVRGVLGMPSIEAVLAFAGTPVTAGNRQDLAADLHRALTRQLEVARASLPAPGTPAAVAPGAGPSPSTPSGGP
jgi:1-acyl-sn-glycerol-3-phosphate acyltransferase